MTDPILTVRNPWRIVEWNEPYESDPSRTELVIDIIEDIDNIELRVCRLEGYREDLMRMHARWIASTPQMYQVLAAISAQPGGPLGEHVLAGIRKLVVT